MRKIKILITKIEEVTRVERVKYLATVNLSTKVKQAKKYLQRKIKQNDEIDISESEVISVEILDSDLIGEETENIEIEFDEVVLDRQNKVTYI